MFTRTRLMLKSLLVENTSIAGFKLWIVKLTKRMVFPAPNGAEPTVGDNTLWLIFLDLFSLVSREDQRQGAKTGCCWPDKVEEDGKQKCLVILELCRHGVCRQTS